MTDSETGSEIKEKAEELVHYIMNGHTGISLYDSFNLRLTDRYDDVGVDGLDLARAL